MARIKGFDLTCPFCGATNEGGEIAITIDLGTLECSCSECDDPFTVAAAVKRISDTLNKWRAVANWVNLIPDAKETADVANEVE